MSTREQQRIARWFRLSPSRVALAYIALSVLALALFAVPLWYAWRANLGTFRSYVPVAQMQTLVDLFHREGAPAVAMAISSRAGNTPGDEIVLFAGPSHELLAGNLAAWPAQVPNAPGIYGLVIDQAGDSSMRVVASHVTLPGGYHLLMGRESVRFESLVKRFWYGIATAVAIVFALGAALAWLLRRALLSGVNEISRTASAIVQGDLSRRLAVRSGSPELDTLAHTVNGMLARLARSREELEALVAQRTDALQRSEERYALVMKASEEGFWDWSVVSDQFYASPRMLRMCGLALDTKFNGRAGFLARVPFHPEDRPKWEQTAAAHCAGNSPRMEMEVRVLSGSETRWIHVTGTATRDASGAVLRWTGATTDITDRKCAEEALRLSEERYALAMDASQDAHWDWIIGSDEYFFSPNTLELYGLPQGTPRSGSRKDFMALAAFLPEDRRAWERAVEVHFAGKSARLSMELRIDRGGEIRWLQLNGLCVRDASGTPVRWTGTTRDVTEHKRMVLALRESDERYALAMEASAVGHWDWKIPTDEYYVSPQHLEIAGFAPDATRSGRAEYVARFPFVPEDREKWQAALDAHFAGTTARFDMEVRIMPRGELRWVHMMGMCARDAAGAPVRWTGSLIDITDRKRAEEALRFSEERYARALEASDDGIWEWNPVSDQAFASPRARHLFGIPEGAEVRTRADLKAHGRFHPEDQQRIDDTIKASLERGEGGFDIEYRVIDPAGEVRWVHSRGKVFCASPGEPALLTGSLTDITQRKRSEQALRQSEERYARAMEGSDAGHWDWNVVTDEMFVSQRARQMLGLDAGVLPATRSEIMALVRMHPEDQQSMDGKVEASLASGVHERDYRVIASSGEVRWLRSRARVFRDQSGAPARMTGSLTDITESKRIEEELRRRQEMLDLAQKSARAIAFEWRIGDGEGENRWSADLEAMYGLAPGTYDGTYESWKTLVHADDWPAVKEAIEHAHRSGDVAYEYRVRHPDGSLHWLQARGRMFFNGAVKPIRMVGFMQDVTQRRHGEEELRKMELALRHAQRLEAMGTLAGGIAHDFNNILGAILGYGEMALRDAKRGTRLRRDLDSIMSAGERGRALVDRILAFSRSGVGERVAVHVEAVVREALDQLAANLPESVTIAPRLHAGRAAMLGDSTQVHQVVMNLTANAVQAMPLGGVVRVALEVTRVDSARTASIGSLSPGEYVVLKVTDTGTGIHPNVVERMFDPFFTTKEVGVGSGLGLSLVHGIVTNVGGAIDVGTELGKGSTFTVYLPRSGDARPAPEADENRPMARGEGQRVLVVDDEEPLVRLATETLEGLGYFSVGFTSSADALKAFDANPGRFDAILTDERMPGVTGSTIIREVRRISPSIPILLMSGYLGAAAALRASELGANDVLKKPLLARELAASLARVLHPQRAPL